MGPAEPGLWSRCHGLSWHWVLGLLRNPLRRQGLGEAAGNFSRSWSCFGTGTKDTRFDGAQMKLIMGAGGSYDPRDHFPSTCAPV